MDASANSFSAILESLNGSAVVVLLGELDLDTGPEFSGVLDPLLDNGPTEVIVGCAGLSFIDSSGIAVLVSAQKRLHGRGGHLTVHSARPHVLKLLTTTGLIDFLHVDIELPSDSARLT
jgi:anti-anti-sigma factor